MNSQKELPGRVPPCVCKAGHEDCRNHAHPHAASEACIHDREQHGHAHESADHCHGHDSAHGHGAEIVENALVLSRSGRLAANGPLSPAKAAERVRSVLLDAAACVAIEGIVPGHLKALLSHGDLRCTLSVTRADICDIQWNGGCSETELSDWSITINLISVVLPERDLSCLLDGLFS